MGKVVLIVLLISLATEHNINLVLEWLFWVYSKFRKGKENSQTTVISTTSQETAPILTSQEKKALLPHPIEPIDRFTTERAIENNENKTLAWDVTYASNSKGKHKI
jgi:hypothetical protein